MNPDQMMQTVREWIYWCQKEPTPYDLSEPMIPRRYWVDENNNRIYPEIQD